VNRFTEHSQGATTDDYNSLTGLQALLKIAVITAHEIKSSMSTFASRFLVTNLNTPQLNTQLLNSELSHERIGMTTHEWTLLKWTELSLCNLEANQIETTTSNTPLLLRLFVAAGTCLPNRCLAMDYSAFRRHVTLIVTNTCFSEPLSSNGLFRLSGVMSQYVAR
jgi:hypothetical protein